MFDFLIYFTSQLPGYCRDRRQWKVDDELSVWRSEEHRSDQQWSSQRLENEDKERKEDICLPWYSM